MVDTALRVKLVADASSLKKSIEGAISNYDASFDKKPQKWELDTYQEIKTMRKSQFDLGKFIIGGGIFLGMVKALSTISPYLKASTEIWKTAFGMFFRPFANFLAAILMPLGILLIKFILWMQKSDWGKTLLAISSGIIALSLAFEAWKIVSSIEEILTGAAVVSSGGVLATGAVSIGSILLGAGAVVIAAAGAAVIAAEIYNAFTSLYKKPEYSGTQSGEEIIKSKEELNKKYQEKYGAGNYFFEPTYNKEMGYGFQFNRGSTTGVPSDDTASAMGKEVIEQAKVKNAEIAIKMLDDMWKKHTEKTGEEIANINASFQTTYIDLPKEMKTSSNTNFIPIAKDIKIIGDEAKTTKTELDKLATRILTMPTYGGFNSSKLIRTKT